MHSLGGKPFPTLTWALGMELTGAAGCQSCGPRGISWFSELMGRGEEKPKDRESPSTLIFPRLHGKGERRGARTIPFD